MKNSVLIFLFVLPCLLTAQDKKQKDDSFPFSDLNKSNVSLGKMEASEMPRLLSLAKVWGLLKYRHPSVAAAKINVDKKLMAILKEFRNRKFDKKLEEWITSFGEVRDFPQRRKPSYEVLNYPEFGWIKRSEDINENAANYLLNLLNAPVSKDHLHFTINANGSVDLHENAHKNLNVDDQGMRLLSLIRYWNAVEYFYAHKHDQSDDWDSAFINYASFIINAQSEAEFHAAFKALMSSTKDQQATFRHLENPSRRPDFDLSMVENKPIVTQVGPSYKGGIKLVAGDRISHINGISVKELITNQRLSGSSDAANDAQLINTLFSTTDESMDIKIVRDEVFYELNAPTYTPDYFEDLYSGSSSISYATDSTLIISPYLFNEELDQTKLKSMFDGAQKIIIDCRFKAGQNENGRLNALMNIPSDDFFLISHVNPHNPGQFYVVENGFTFEADSTLAEKELIIFIDENTKGPISKDILFLQSNYGATLVGKASNQFNSTSATIKMPGNNICTLTCQGIYDKDKNPISKSGLSPDISVNYSTFDLRQKSDVWKLVIGVR